MSEASSRIVVPSLLAADHGRLGEEAVRALEAGADWLHVDVMDGHFVDNLSFGPGIVRGVAKAAGAAYLDVHLMMVRPDRYWPAFAEAGAGGITVHVEAEHDAAETLRAIRGSGCRTGLALRPATPFRAAEPFLAEIDLLLVMTVEPGFGGQAFLLEMLPKIAAAKAARERLGLGYDIEVDGGIDQASAAEAARAGANVLVAGSSLFQAPDMAVAIRELREAE
ncbi:MAG TPA: ribulose-phosphate 3-epimerase [Verrucomicrobiales bacterium]|nr:ribulose-phosphate 3-epimerase [Verrucomicrobiales bacterium]